MKIFIRIRLSSIKSNMENYFENSLLGGELNSVSRMTGRDTHHYSTEDLMLEEKSNVFASALQRKMMQ